MIVYTHTYSQHKHRHKAQMISINLPSFLMSLPSFVVVPALLCFLLQYQERQKMDGKGGQLMFVEVV